MKRIVACLIFSLALVTSCKKEVKKTEEIVKEATIPNYSIDQNTTKITWTAYKTTSKTPVKGTFTELNINKPIKSESKQGCFANLKFDIPVSSFFSSNEVRDAKIKNLFFGVMKETTMISGEFSNITGNDDEGSMTLNLKMNGEIVAVPMTYKINENTVTIDGVLNNLMDWKMTDAFNSLHKACKLLHTGEDGISRTWEDVAITATTILKVD